MRQARSKLSKKAKAIGLNAPFVFHRLSQEQIPDEVARSILADPELHVESFVTSCEQSFGSSVVKASKKVSEVANSEGWFDPQGE